ncbi:U-box domain-containing protein 16 [Nicotiana tabacum]|uniref:RING-type E3 ubiquitin transferase n=2 Tax=Nicotiana TaxID=4085 RepID=A0A1S4AF44_TOBAC|nr:PREDICTED: U-box domain-containing protein 16 [Nicotiana sylvestris]XP_016475261.1 PREDICTED: U-box domain-containing protein 16-like [Nicotiana tabacum]
MAVSPEESFPPRKRRPSANSFVAPNLSDHNLLRSLLLLSSEISTLQPLLFLLKKNTSSIIRKSKLLSILFEEISGRDCSSSNDPTTSRYVTGFPPSAALCFDELYIVLQRIKTLLEDCRNCSKMWLLMQIEVFSNAFHELTLELAILLDILPAKKLKLNDDVQELLILITKQCSDNSAYVDPKDQDLRSQIVEMLDRIEREIVPDQSKLAEIFDKLTLRDSMSCRDEIELLEEEIQSQTDEKSKSDIIALIGFVRYAKCVLYGGSTPRTNSRRRRAAADVSVPADFRCPISLDLMRDPVVVSTGQTYDRSSITLWFESGHTTCPKTGQTLTHTELTPNSALKNLIAMWCREQKIPFESTELNVKSTGIVTNKTALEATKMTVSFLINKLKTSQSVETANRLVHELRVLAKADSDSRACIAEASALPLLVKLLGLEHPSLQVNAVTTILNLSILEANKTRIMETDGVLNGVIEVLRSGGTWEAKGNAAATIFSLTGVPAYKKRLARKTRVVKGLMDLARGGPTNSKRDALVAILNLAGDREAVGKLIEGGVVEMVAEIMDGLMEEAVAILEVVVKKGGLVAVAAAYPLIKKLAIVLRDGTDRARESAAATLVNMCRKGGSDMVAELAAVQGIERVIWEIMGMGTGRARRKAATLLRVLRRWAAGLDAEVASGAYSDVNMNTTSTRIVLPG